MIQSTPHRNTKHGITLIATLVSLMMIISIATLLQAAALSNTKTLKRLMRQQEEEIAIDAVRELSRPLVAGMFLEQESRISNNHMYENLKFNIKVYSDTFLNQMVIQINPIN